MSCGGLGDTKHHQMSRSYIRPSRLAKVQALIELGATEGEREAARAAAERLRARYPQPLSAPILLPDHLARWRVELRTVASASAKDRASVLHWVASRAREARRAGKLAYPDLTVLIEALRRTALQAGLDQWSTERSIGLAMKMMPRDRR